MKPPVLCTALVWLFLLSGCTANVHQVLPDVPSQMTLLTSDDHKTATMSASWDIDLNSPRYDHELRMKVVAAWIPVERDGDLYMTQLVGPVISAVVIRNGWFRSTVTNATVEVDEFQIEHDRGSRYREGEAFAESGSREEWRTFDLRIKFDANALMEAGLMSLGSNAGGWVSVSFCFYANGEIELLHRSIMGSVKDFTTFNAAWFQTSFE